LSTIDRMRSTVIQGLQACTSAITAIFNARSAGQFLELTLYRVILGQRSGSKKKPNTATAIAETPSAAKSRRHSRRVIIEVYLSRSLSNLNTSDISSLSQTVRGSAPGITKACRMRAAGHDREVSGAKND